MSDSYLRLIPTEPGWVPLPEASERACAALAQFCPAADDITMRITAQPEFIDQGSNFDAVRCPGCAEVLSSAWWSEAMGHAYARAFTDLDIITPCCHVAATLNDLHYDWPAGFARHVIEVSQPARGWLRDDELATVAAALGHPVRQIMSRV